MARPRIPRHIAKAVQKYREENPGAGEAIRQAPGIRPDSLAVAETLPQTATAIPQTGALKEGAKVAIPPESGHSEIFTYTVTNLGTTELFYSAPSWTKVQLILETAGPVDIGTRQEITPVGSGKGYTLLTGVPIIFELVRGDRLFIAANAVNRVGCFFNPIPWQEQQTVLTAQILEVMKSK